VAPRIEINDFISDLARQHATTLRFLYLDSLRIGNARQFLCENFLNLEELSVADFGGNLVRKYSFSTLLFADDRCIYSRLSWDLLKR
jgi:hypothetical protein